MNYSCISERGNRPINEDSLGVAQSNGAFCFTLCDGLGGHGRGDVASQTAVSAFMAAFADKPEKLTDALELAFERSINAISSKGEEDGSLSQMKTTVVALAVDGNACCWGHIGDSRLYAFKNGRVAFRTQDHSVPQMLVKSGEIDSSAIRRHPDRNKLLRAMGVDNDSPGYELSALAETDGYDAFLLCSDGFWELINERKICRCLRHSSNAREWLASMTRTVRRKGERINMDNYSAITVILNGKESG